MRVAVTGGRTWGRIPVDTPPHAMAAARVKANAEHRRLNEALDEIHAATPIAELIHGDCRGADRFAAEWAGRRGIRVTPFPVDWDNIDLPGARIRRNGRGKFYDATAGYRRNLRMLIEGAPELVIAFPGGNGTAHMTAQALKRDIAVLRIDA